MSNQGGSSSISVGTIIAIVIIISVVAFIGLATFFLWLSRRRARRDGRDMMLTGDRDSDASTTATRPRSRKLSKLSTSTTIFTMRSISPFHAPSLPFVHPPFRQPSLICNGSTSPGGRNSRSKSQFWIDEDVLHGPRSAGHSRGSFPDAWSLRSMATVFSKPPTSGQACESEQSRAQQHREDGGQQTSSSNSTFTGLALVQDATHRSLPRLPQLAAISGSWQHTSPDPTGAYYSPDDVGKCKPTGHGEPAALGMATPPFARTRRSSTSTTLSEILRETDKRLQTGGMSGVAKRNMTARSNGKTPYASEETLIAKSEPITDGSTLCQSLPPSLPPSRASSPVKPAARQGNPRTAPEAPSPTKPVASQPLPASHERQPSDTSAVSETDSIFNQPSLEPDTPSGLTSPSRSKAPEQESKSHRPPSPTSSLSSALSTLYSEDEAHDASSRRSAANPSRACQPGRRGAAVAPLALHPVSLTPGPLRPRSAGGPSPAGGGANRSPQRPATQPAPQPPHQELRLARQARELRLSAPAQDTIRIVHSTSSSSLADAGILRQPPRHARKPASLDSTDCSGIPRPAGAAPQRLIPSTERPPPGVPASPSDASALSGLTFLHADRRPSTRLTTPASALRPQASSPTLGRRRQSSGGGGVGMAPPLAAPSHRRVSSSSAATPSALLLPRRAGVASGPRAMPATAVGPRRRPMSADSARREGSGGGGSLTTGPGQLRQMNSVASACSNGSGSVHGTVAGPGSPGGKRLSGAGAGGRYVAAVGRASLVMTGASGGERRMSVGGAGSGPGPGPGGRVVSSAKESGVPRPPEGLREGTDWNKGMTPGRGGMAGSPDKMGASGFGPSESQASLGLYDKDGFLITTPATEPSSPTKAYAFRG